jgi:hypothetical protein
MAFNNSAGPYGPEPSTIPSGPPFTPPPPPEEETTVPQYGPFGQQYFLESISSMAPSAANLRIWAEENKDWLAHHGWSFEDHHRDPKLVRPDGIYVDVLRNAGGTNRAWVWTPEDGSQSSREGAGQWDWDSDNPYRVYGQGADQPWSPDISYLEDTPQFDFEFEPWVSPEDFTYQPYEAPAPFEYQPFAPPSQQDVSAFLESDPGYQLRLQEGWDALQNTAAAKGLLRSGRTIRELEDYRSGLASDEYEKAYNRRRQDWLANQRNRADAWTMNVGAGRDAYGLQRGAALEEEQMRRDEADKAYQRNELARYGLAQDRYKARLDSWKNRQDAMRDAAEKTFQRQWDAYSYGQPSASQIFAWGTAPGQPV